MALIDPPIDKLISKAGSKYALSVLVSKRAKEISVSKKEFFDEHRDQTPITMAAMEFDQDKIKMSKY